MRTLPTTLLAVLAMFFPVTGFTVVDPADVEKGDTVLLTIEDQRRFVQPLNLFGVFRGQTPSLGTYTIEFRMGWNPDETNNAWLENQPTLDRGDPLSVPQGMGDLRQVSREEADELVAEMHEAVSRARTVWDDSGTFDEIFEQARQRAEALESLGLDLNSDLLRLYSERIWVQNKLWATDGDSLNDKRKKIARVRSEAVVERVRSTLREAEALRPAREMLAPRLHYYGWKNEWMDNPPAPDTLPGRYLVDVDAPPVRMTARQWLAVDLLRYAAIRSVKRFYYSGGRSEDPSDTEAREEARKTFAPYLSLITDGGTLLPEDESLEGVLEQLVEQHKKM